MKLSNFLFLLWSLFTGTLNGQVDGISIPFVIESNGKAVTLLESENSIAFYSEGVEIAIETFSYEPYTLGFNQRSTEYFKSSKVDSVIFTFYCTGIFGDQYKYRITIPNDVSLFDLENELYFRLVINDILNLKRNQKVIDKLGVPYYYSFYRQGADRISSYHNWYSDKKLATKNNKKKIQAVDYFDYRVRFWDEM